MVDDRAIILLKAIHLEFSADDLPPGNGMARPGQGSWRKPNVQRFVPARPPYNVTFPSTTFDT